MRHLRSPDKVLYLNALNLVEQEDVPFVETEADFRVVEQVLGRKVPGVRRSYTPESDLDVHHRTRVRGPRVYLPQEAQEDST